MAVVPRSDKSANLYTGAMASASATGWSWFHPRVTGDLPLVCLHGFGGDPLAWRPVAAALAEPMPMAAPALPGHREAPVAAATFDGNVGLLLAALDAQEIDRAHLVGYSLGGRLALGIARLAPSRVATLTLLAAHPGLPTLDTTRRSERIASDRAWAQRLRSDGTAGFFAAWESQPLFASQAHLPSAVRAGQSELRADLDAIRLADAMEGMGLGSMPDGRATLAAFAAKTTVATGSLDEKFTALAQGLQRELAIEHVSVDGVGHNLLLEAPERVAQLLVTTRAHAQPKSR